jgi:SAM-dependent methyltransferase
MTVDWHARFLQQAAWTHDLRRYLFARAGLQSARRVLEVGCGTGAVLANVATRSHLAAHGLDREAGRLLAARIHAPQATLARGDALALPYPGGAFDLVFCHFLLLWVADPLQALREMKRVTRPGGAVLALAEPDYGSRRDEPAELAPLGQAQAEALRRQGADPDLGRRLAGLFQQAGLPPIETGSLQEREENRLTPREREAEWAVIESDLAGIVPGTDLERLKRLDEAAWAAGERRLHVPTHYAWSIAR